MQTDDDGDGWFDVAEETCDGDKDDSSIEPTDSDGDGSVMVWIQIGWGRHNK